MDIRTVWLKVTTEFQIWWTKLVVAPFGKGVDYIEANFQTMSTAIVWVFGFLFGVFMCWAIAMSLAAMNELIDTVKTIPQEIHIEMMENRQVMQDQVLEMFRTRQELEAEAADRKASSGTYDQTIAQMEKERLTTSAEIAKLKVQLAQAEVDANKRHKVFGIF